MKGSDEWVTGAALLVFAVGWVIKEIIVAWRKPR